MNQRKFWGVSREVVAILRSLGGRATNMQLVAGTLHRDVDDVVSTCERLVKRGLLLEDEEGASLAPTFRPGPDHQTTLKLTVRALAHLGERVELGLVVRRVQVALSAGWTVSAEEAEQAEARLGVLVNRLAGKCEAVERETGASS